jgi:hypothetical protein
MKTNKRKLAKETCDRVFKIWQPLYDIIERETEQAIDGDYYNNIIEYLQKIKMFPLIDYFITMKSIIEETEIERTTYKSPEYINSALKYWKDELATYQSGADKQMAKLKQLQEKVLPELQKQ